MMLPICKRSVVHLTTTILTWLVVSSCACYAAQNTGTGKEIVHLVYNDATLPQKSRRQLVRLLASQSLDYWNKVQVQASDTGLYKVIERVFNLSPLHGAESKATVELLVAEIKRANKEKATALEPGTTLIVPPPTETRLPHKPKCRGCLEDLSRGGPHNAVCRFSLSIGETRRPESISRS